jgi:hypothetical protein
MARVQRAMTVKKDSDFIADHQTKKAKHRSLAFMLFKK